MALGEKLDINQSTYVRLGAVIAVLGAFWIPYQWLDSRFSKLERDAAAASIRMDDAIRRIESASQDRWTRTHQRLYTLELQIRNPKLVVPDVAADR